MSGRCRWVSVVRFGRTAWRRGSCACIRGVSAAGKRRYRTATVVGNRDDAERGLAELVASVRSEQSVGSRSTVSELLEAWFVVASGSWAPTTIRQTRSVVDRYLHPQLGAFRVGELTPTVIDAAECGCVRRVGVVGRGCRLERWLGCMSCCAQRWRKRSGGGRCSTTRSSVPIASRSARPNTTPDSRRSCDTHRMVR